MPKVYTQGDTSFTRCMDMIRNASPASLFHVPNSQAFRDELQLCNDCEKECIRNAYRYYKKYTTD